jgi:TM2 domain-containing membrane protein YozV
MTDRKDKTIAILLVFFLGGIGVHKFYLGETTAGVIYLIFCWTLIPSIIAFFEFIGMLMMSDQTFNARYNGAIAGGGFQYNLPQESSRDKAAAMAELKGLYDQGIITAEEYETKRRKLLDSI